MRSAFSNNHSNNFDALRIFAALTVLAVHQHALMGKPEPGIAGVATWGLVAVWVFFVISGYLVSQSWANDPHLIRFSVRRILRIWPALTIVVALSVLALGPWVTWLSYPDYWRSDTTWGYFRNLLMDSRYHLPGVFDKAPGNTSVNGSLWTIPYEVYCYVALAIAGCLGLLGRPIWLAIPTIAYIGWYIAQGLPDHTGLLDHGRELGLYFLAGVGLFRLRTFWQPRRWTVMIATWAVAAALWYAHLHHVALVLMLPMTVLAIGSSSWPILRKAGQYGDPSYGLYLYAFPIQQLVVHFTYPHWSYEASVALAMLLTTIAAYLSWHGVEKLAMRFKPQRR